MDKNTEWILNMFHYVAEDTGYVQMRKKYLVLQKQFEEIVSQMPPQEQDILWDFVCTSDAMNWRMLEVIREYYALEI